MHMQKNAPASSLHAERSSPYNAFATLSLILILRFSEESCIGQFFCQLYCNRDYLRYQLYSSSKTGLSFICVFFICQSSSRRYSYRCIPVSPDSSSLPSPAYLHALHMSFRKQSFDRMDQKCRSCMLLLFHLI